MVANQDKYQKRPKVIHSFPIWLPQTQTWMYNQVNQLQRLGVEAHVVCDRTENLDQFRVANIHSLQDEPYYKRIWDKGLRKVGVRRHLNYLLDVGKKVNARIIHSHFGNIGWTNLEVVRRLEAKHVVTFYGLDINQLPIRHPIWRQRYHELFSEVDRVLCEGSYMARSIVELGCPSNKVKVQHLGIDLENIPFRPRRWRPGEPLRVLIAASFREKKGIPYAIEALEIIARKQPMQLTIIGDAGRGLASRREKWRIMSALERSGLKVHTRMLGYQPHKIMLQEAYRHHLFLQPSVTARNGDTEGGAPVAIIEMLASGMLVCATTHCDIPEVFGSGAHSLLVPERDVVKLAECIQKLLAIPSEWDELAGEVRGNIDTEYNRFTQAKSLLSHYEELL